jgi:hypothetical protein
VQYSEVEKLLTTARETPDQNIRLKSLTQAQKLVSPLFQSGIYAQPPLPTALWELYLYYLDNQHYSEAVILLLFIQFNCNVITYPQPHHPLNGLFSSLFHFVGLPVLESGSRNVISLQSEIKASACCISSFE